MRPHTHVRHDRSRTVVLPRQQGKQLHASIPHRSQPPQWWQVRPEGLFASCAQTVVQRSCPVINIQVGLARSDFLFHGRPIRLNGSGNRRPPVAAVPRQQRRVHASWPASPFFFSFVARTATSSTVYGLPRRKSTYTRRKEKNLRRSRFTPRQNVFDHRKRFKKTLRSISSSPRVNQTLIFSYPLLLSSINAANAITAVLHPTSSSPSTSSPTSPLHYHHS